MASGGACMRLLGGPSATTCPSTAAVRARTWGRSCMPPQEGSQMHPPWPTERLPQPEKSTRHDCTTGTRHQAPARALFAAPEACQGGDAASALPTTRVGTGTCRRPRMKLVDVKAKFARLRACTQLAHRSPSGCIVEKDGPIEGQPCGAHRADQLFRSTTPCRTDILRTTAWPPSVSAEEPRVSKKRPKRGSFHTKRDHAPHSIGPLCEDTPNWHGEHAQNAVMACLSRQLRPAAAEVRRQARHAHIPVDLQKVGGHEYQPVCGHSCLRTRG